MSFPFQKHTKYTMYNHCIIIHIASIHIPCYILNLQVIPSRIQNISKMMWATPGWTIGCWPSVVVSMFVIIWGSSFMFVWGYHFLNNPPHRNTCTSSISCYLEWFRNPTSTSCARQLLHPTIYRVWYGFKHPRLCIESMTCQECRKTCDLWSLLLIPSAPT